MKLYWGKHTCAIGIHVMLEETGAPYELQELDIKAKEHTRPPFSELNPKQKVPVLVRDDGSVMTEYGTIAAWLASTYKDADLLPFDDLERQTRMYEAMDYLVGTVHGQAFHHLFMPEQFAEGSKDEATLAEVKAKGRAMAEKGFAIVGVQLGQGPWLVGEQFTIGDTALFYTARWAPEMGVTLPDNVAAHLERMKARPSVAKVMKQWGEA